jgi:hypothetical protein
MYRKLFNARKVEAYKFMPTRIPVEISNIPSTISNQNINCFVNGNISITVNNTVNNHQIPTSGKFLLYL